MPGPYGQLSAVTIKHAGRRWSGHWKVEGGEVCVESAYGSERVPLGRRKPDKVAADALRRILERRHA